MGLEHDKGFTPEERDQVLHLAARLQAQHEEKVGADELVRVAEEVGIEARFVLEASQAIRSGNATAEILPSKDAIRPLVPLLVLNLALTFRDLAMPIFNSPLYGVFLLATGILSYRAVRQGAAPWAVPAVIVAIWIVQRLLADALHRFSPIGLFDARYLHNKELLLTFAIALGAVLLAYVAEKMEIRPRAANVGP